VLFNVPAAESRGPLDIEQLIVDTALACPADPRLYIAAWSWLSRHSSFIAPHRLKRLALEQLDPQNQATLGLLMETAVEHGAAQHLLQIVSACLETAPEPGPLFDVDRDWFEDSAQLDATALSKKWGRWCQAIELKPDALRPTEWILANNPSFRDESR